MGIPKIRKAAIVDVTFGENVTVVEPANLYGCTIGDGTFVGPFTEIQRGAVIGKRCKIQSHAFVCDLVTIGDDSIVSHGAKFINDPFKTGGPANRKRELWGETKVGSHVSIGTNATILPVTICDNVVIGAGSVVTKNITEPGIYAGNPARLLRRLRMNFGVRRHVRALPRGDMSPRSRAVTRHRTPKPDAASET